jgi:hypothetical protein
LRAAVVGGFPAGGLRRTEGDSRWHVGVTEPFVAKELARRGYDKIAVRTEW